MPRLVHLMKFACFPPFLRLSQSSYGVCSAWIPWVFSDPYCIAVHEEVAYVVPLILGDVREVLVFVWLVVKVLYAKLHFLLLSYVYAHLNTAWLPMEKGRQVNDRFGFQPFWKKKKPTLIHHKHNCRSDAYGCLSGQYHYNWFYKHVSKFFLLTFHCVSRGRPVPGVQLVGNRLREASRKTARGPG